MVVLYVFTHLRKIAQHFLSSRVTQRQSFLLCYHKKDECDAQVRKKYTENLVTFILDCFKSTYVGIFTEFFCFKSLYLGSNVSDVSKTILR